MHAVFLVIAMTSLSMAQYIVGLLQKPRSAETQSALYCAVYNTATALSSRLQMI